MEQELSFSDKLLSVFTKSNSISHDQNPLISRYQSLAIIWINVFFVLSMTVWKLISIFICKLPGDETIMLFVPIELISLILLKTGKKDHAALILLLAIHIGNLVSSVVCNMPLGAAYLVILLPGVTYFISSSMRLHGLNLVLCFIQNFSHMRMINRTFRVTFTEDQNYQIFTLEIISCMYIPLSWILFILQKHIETHLWQVVHLNYTKAEDITKELVEAVTAKDRVVCSFSHEIRNALNSLNGCNNYLLKVTTDPKHLKVLKNAKLSGEILLNLVNNVLDAAKLKAEKLELAYIQSNPISIINKVLDINSETLSSKKIITDVHFDESIPPKLYLDPSRFLQVIMNLFSNSLKSTNERERINICTCWYDESTPTEDLLAPFDAKKLVQRPMLRNQFVIKSQRSLNIPYINDISENTSPEVDELNPADCKKRSRNLSYLELPRPKIHFIEELNSAKKLVNTDRSPSGVDSAGRSSLIMRRNTTQNAKGFLKVQISDTGCGISEEFLPKLFTMFTQAGGGHQQESEGTGLGLWISKQLCQKMGGDIAIYSKVDLGTTVVFYIVANTGQLMDNNTSQLRSRKVRALVVDDYPYNREVHKLILEREGVEVSLACDGKEALEKYVSHEEDYFKFILMDIQMPEMDGITAAQKMRQFETDQRRKSIEIYFVSANYYSKNEALGAINSISTGSDLTNTHFLRKPIDLGIVKQIVENYQLVE